MSTNLDLQPVAEVHCGRLRWHIPHDNYSVPLKFTNNDTHLLYDRETVDAKLERLRAALQRIAHFTSATPSLSESGCGRLLAQIEHEATKALGA